MNIVIDTESYGPEGRNSMAVVNGITLRDLFAMAVAAGSSTGEGGITDPTRFGSYCYELADGLLAAREAKVSP